MKPIPIALPNGMFRNGTPYGARGRWVDGNLVRWHDNAMRPIGGWTRRKKQSDGTVVPAIIADPDVEAVRDAISYITNDGVPVTIFGSNSAIYRLDNGNNLSAALPVPDFTPGSKGPSELFGYGVGPYGAGTYGTRRNFGAGILQPAQRWAFDTWGENVLAAGIENGPVYEITPTGDPVALMEAPEDVSDLIVTDQRIVMALVNNSTDIRQVVWSDRENNSVWTPAVDNYAGSFRLQGNGKAIGLYKVLNQVLILTETDAFSGRYIGAPFVYGFERVGSKCAPVHHKAVAKTDRFAVWLGKRNFWLYDGTLRSIPCDVMDYITETLSVDNVSKIHCQTIAEYSEIWWFYQSVEGTEVDSYVVFDYAESHWFTGKLSRLAGFDASPSPYPTMVDALGQIWDHEQDAVLVDGQPFALSGPLELDNGGRNMAIRYVLPDTERPNTCELYFLTRQMPTEPDTEHGPFPYENPISTTGVLGREIRMGVRGLTSQFEIGTMRFDVAPVGGGSR